MSVTNYTSVTGVWARDGTKVYPTVQDTNGNYMSSGSSVVDTLGRTVLTYVPNGAGCSASYCYNILAPNGNTSQVQVTTTTVNYNTLFGQSGVTEASGSFTAIQSITLPDNTSYTFDYDSGTTAGHYGELTSVTLPTGAQTTYTYGVFPTSTPTENRNEWVTQRTVSGGGVPTGTWEYTLTDNVTCPSGAPSGSTCLSSIIKPPSGNWTVYKFIRSNGSWQGVADYYTLTSSGTHLMNVSTTYDFSLGTHIRRATVSTTVYGAGGAARTKKSVYTYDSATRGNITKIAEYKFGNSSGTPDRQTSITYLTGSAYINRNILDRPTEIKVTNGSASPTTYADTKFSYDSTGLQSVSPAPTHWTDPGTTTRGNPTYVQRWISGSTWANTTIYYDTTGQVASFLDPKGNSTTFSYTDQNAYVSQITLPQTGSTAHTLSFSYDFNTGLLTSSSDQNSQPTTFSYDNMLRPTSTGYPDGGSVNATYTGATLQDIYSLILGSTTRHDQVDLDGLGRVTGKSLVNDPGGQTYVDTSYDLFGRVASVSNPYRGSSTGGDSYAYDGLNRVTSVTHPDSNLALTAYGASAGGTQSCSTGVGYPTLFTDEAGKKRRTWTDGLGRLVEVHELNTDGTLLYATCYGYDLLDNLTGVTQGSQTRTYYYDRLSRLTQATTPESGTVSFTYDGNGNVLTRVAPKPNQTGSLTVTTTYTYDALNRLTGKTYSNGDPAVSYFYDQTSYNGLTITNGKGRRTGMSDASGQTAWSYDAAGRVLTEQRTIGSVTKTTSYVYNLAGEPISITYPSSQNVITYTYSDVGRPLSAVDSANSINYALNATYAPHGAGASVLEGQSGTFGGIAFSAAYTNRLVASQLQASSSNGDAFDVGYSYFPNLNVSTLTNNRDNTRTQTFTYDSLNRVITGQSTATSGDNCWGQSIPTDGTGYDRWGNLLKVNSTKCSTPGLNVATDGSNHLSGFGYDAAGNMTNDGLYTYTYNAEGQQASTSAASQTYTYDGDGRRVKKSNGRTYWFSSVTGNLLVETDGSGTVLNQYIYFGGRRVARKDGSGNVTYYFEEPAGRTRTITGANGAPCNEADYYLFGGEQSHGNTCDQNYHFAGMYRDGETGNDYTQFRMYESNLGRWMTPDPLAGDISNPQSLNRYAYVLNNPTNLIDPLGLQGCHQEDDCPRPDDAHTVDLSPLIDLINHGPDPYESHPGDNRPGHSKSAKPAPKGKSCISPKSLPLPTRALLSALSWAAKRSGGVRGIGIGGAGAFSPPSLGGGGGSVQVVIMADYMGNQGLYWSVSGGPTVGKAGAGVVFGSQYMTSTFSETVTIQDVVNSSLSFGAGAGEGFGVAADYNPQTSVLTDTIGFGVGGWGGAGSLNIASGFIPVCKE
jgi:RHS repeat-associated protein